MLEISSIAVDVGRWILDTACAFAGELATSGYPVRMGVNLFAAQLRDQAFTADVLSALARNRLPAHLLELEITETTVLGVDADTLQPLQALRAGGVGIAFDDYGTGFASLSLLKKYPLTRLKIDREFVRDIEKDPDDAAIVEAVLAMGRSLRLEVIAEGMETQAQADILKQLRCSEAQGYLFGKPMPADEFRSRIARKLDARARVAPV
nr:EAL domain-containing protein [Rhizobium smilacinae]